MTETKPSCATCKETIAPRSENRFFPFCSARCKQVDLGRWLNEEHRIPFTQDSTERSIQVDEYVEE